MKRMVFLAFLIFCTWNSNAAFAAMAKAGGEKVIVGLPTTSMSMLPIFLAQDKGLFREEGLEPQLVFVGDVLDYPQGGLAITDKKLQENPAQVKRVVWTMVRSLIRIRQNRDELVPYIANGWKIDTEFAASSYDTMLKAYSPKDSTSRQSIQSVIDSIKGRNPAIGISHVVNFGPLEEVQREMKIK